MSSSAGSSSSSASAAAASATGPSRWTQSSGLAGSSSSAAASAPGAAPAGGGQSDTALWLHNKLGTSNDSWTGGSIVSQLNPEMLDKIRNCFQDLEPQVKLKLLLSIFHITRRNLEAWRRELESILDVAQEDSEPWVCMLAELMKTYPASGQLNSDIHVPDSNKKIFTDLISDLKRALRRCEQVDSILPIECHYLNKNAFLSVVGHQPQQTKHFTLKRKPKAAALKVELMNKSQDAATKLKSSSSGAFPMRKNTMPRKMSDTSALKGLNRALSGFKNPRTSTLPNRSLRKPESGGVKLLDINEQPIGLAARKRQRQKELEEQRANKDSAAAAASESAKEDGHAAAAEKATPDYAAGLSTMNPPTPAAPTPSYAPATPSYAPEPPQVPVLPPAPTAVTAAAATPKPALTSLPAQVTLPTTPLAPSSLQQPAVVVSSAQPSLLRSVITQQQQLTPQPQLATPGTAFPAGLTTLEPLPQSALGQPPAATYVSEPAPTATRIVQLPSHPLPQARLATPVVAPGTTIIQGGNLGNIRTILSGIPQNASASLAQTPAAPVQPAPLQPTSATIPAPQQQRRSLSLTKDQMDEAKEIFRTANKVTRPEKALILGFMAGSRDNPCPHLGNVVTIKLSENQENVLQSNRTYLTMIVETHFQMNYSSGEWNRIRKYRRIEEVS